MNDDLMLTWGFSKHIDAVANEAQKQTPRLLCKSLCQCQSNAAAMVEEALLVFSFFFNKLSGAVVNQQPAA